MEPGYKEATYTHSDGVCPKNPYADPTVRLLVPENLPWEGVSCGACGQDLEPLAG
jgi:hypothetical protein